MSGAPAVFGAGAAARSDMSGRSGDRAAVVATVRAFARAFDARDWEGLRALLTDTLRVDYAAFRGEPPGWVSAEAYVASRRRGLAGLRTRHVTRAYVVAADGETAACTCSYRIVRTSPSRPPGRNRLETTGTYEFGLVRTASGWRIGAIRQTVSTLEGDPTVHGARRGDDQAGPGSLPA